MNTRIQVEHAVTEMITGLDLVQMQLRLARGDDLSAFDQDEVARPGHAIECRVYAENPAKNFMPSPGRLAARRLPVPATRVRIDTGFEEGDEITAFYDPLIAKVIVWGAIAHAAIARVPRRARPDPVVEGAATNLALLRAVLDHPAFVGGRTFTNFLDIHKAELLAPAWRRAVAVSIGGIEHGRTGQDPIARQYLEGAGQARRHASRRATSSSSWR